MPERSDFWSRRRRAVAAEAARTERRLAGAEAESTAAALEDRSDAEILQMLGLPDPEALTPADAARFMAREIPARLRRRAIRYLFRAHPHLSMPDGLQDYDEDYTDAAVNVRPDPGAWAELRARAGRMAERAAEKAPEPRPDAGSEEGAADAAPRTLPAGDPPPATAAPAEGAAAAIADPAPDPEEDGSPPQPRRMTFRFEETPT